MFLKLYLERNQVGRWWYGFERGGLPWSKVNECQFFSSLSKLAGAVHDFESKLAENTDTCWNWDSPDTSADKVKMLNWNALEVAAKRKEVLSHDHGHQDELPAIVFIVAFYLHIVNLTPTSECQLRIQRSVMFETVTSPKTVHFRQTMATKWFVIALEVTMTTLLFLFQFTCVGHFHLSNRIQALLWSISKKFISRKNSLVNFNIE